MFVSYVRLSEKSAKLKLPNQGLFELTLSYNKESKKENKCGQRSRVSHLLNCELGLSIKGSLTATGHRACVPPVTYFPRAFFNVFQRSRGKSLRKPLLTHDQELTVVNDSSTDLDQ